MSVDYNPRHIFKALDKDDTWIHWLVMCPLASFKNVKYETLCQCTGHKDKDGRLIYENDVVMYRGEKAVIVYQEDKSRFVIDIPKINDGVKRRYTPLDQYLSKELEAIGNIHEMGRKP